MRVSSVTVNVVGRWQTEVMRDLGVSDDLVEWWGSQQAARDNPLLNPHVLSCWYDGLEEGGSELRIICLKRDGEVVAALPLYKARGRYRTLLRTYASSMDVVSIPDADVSARLPGWLDQLNIANLYRFPENSPIVQGIDEHPRWALQSTIPAPYVDLTGGIDSVRSQWSTSFRKSLRRRARRLEELGEVAYTDHPRPDQVSDVLTEGLRLEASGWKGRDGVAVLLQPGYESWFRSVAEVAGQMGWLRLSSLYLDDRMIAFSFDLEYGHRRHSLMSAYDEGQEISRLSPGNALVDRILETSADRGMLTYELGYGGQQWKYDWTSAARQVHDILILGAGPVGRALSMIRRVKSQRSARTSSARSTSSGEL